MKQYIKPQSATILLHTEAPLFGPSTVNEEVGNGVQCAPGLEDWTETEWTDEEE